MTHITKELATAVPRSIAQTGPETGLCEWLKTSDGVAHFMRLWRGAIGGPVIVYLHGIEGHGWWFKETALVLAQQGISTYAPDRRGAGSSKETRGHISSHKRLIQDIQELISVIQNRHPASSIFLVGNCWGAKVALSAAARDTSGLIKGLVLTSPAVAVQVDVALPTKLAIGLNYVFAGGRGYFDIPLTPGHFTDQPEYLDYIATDPLRLTRATAAFFVESLRLTRACTAASKTVRIPVLVVQSGRDLIVNIARIEQWFETLPAFDKTLRIFPSAAHSLDFDANAEEYQRLLGSWILSRTSTGAMVE